jgi:glycosyltransferase involved in cell wall biosynthesis
MTKHVAPQVSVVVPVFNTAPYLRKCLESLTGSTLTDIEIICVDDASTDSSVEIVEGFARQDERIRLIRHARNQGLGAARNTGIAAARAAYVGGVDSDDWVGPTMFERLLEGTDGGRADVVEGGYLQIDTAGEVVRRHTPTPRVVENDQNQINIFEITRPAFYTKLWRRSLFVDNDIWFPPRLYFEDLATTPRLLAKARRIHFIEDASYFYLMRDGSITFSASERHQMDHFKVFDILLDFLWENDLVGRYGKQFATQIGNRLSYHAGNVLKFDVPEKNKAQYLRHMLMMARGYQEFHVELHEASRDDLIALFKRNFPLEKAKEMSELGARKAALEAEVSRLGERAASLDAEIADRRRVYQDMISDPVWKVMAPLSRLRSGRRAKRKLKRAARQ